MPPWLETGRGFTSSSNVILPVFKLVSRLHTNDILTRAYIIGVHSIIITLEVVHIASISNRNSRVAESMNNLLSMLNCTTCGCE